MKMQPLLYPLLRHADRSDSLAHDAAGPISVERFLGDVAALAACLPDGRHVVNLCIDRYRFTVGFASALVREQITLLPSSDAEAPLEQLARNYEGVYFLHDTDFGLIGRVQTFSFPRNLVSVPSSPVPSFPVDRTAAILFTSGDRKSVV